MFEQAGGQSEQVVWCRATYDEIGQQFGPAKMTVYLSMLASRLEAAACLLSSADVDREDLRQQAHDLVATAGMFGFLDVLQHCRTVQVMIQDDHLPAGALVAFRVAVLDALARIDEDGASAAARPHAA